MSALPADPKAEARQRAIAAVDVRLGMAKQRIALAALACMRGALDAEQQVAAALAQIDQARAELRQVDADA